MRSIITPQAIARYITGTERVACAQQDLEFHRPGMASVVQMGLIMEVLEMFFRLYNQNIAAEVFSQAVHYSEW